MNVPLSVIIGSIAVVGAIPLLVWGLVSSSHRTSDSIQRNLLGARVSVDEREVILETSALERAVLPAIRSLAARVRRLTPAGWMDSLERRLRMVGSPRRWPIERILAAKIILGMAGALLAISYLAAGMTTLNISRAIVVPLLGYFAPDLILWGRAQERQKRIQMALPDTLDQMTISVEAGLGFDGALRRTAMAGDGPLPEELKRVLAEVRVGVTRRRAFQNLLERTDVPELRHFVFAVQQAEEYGLPIAQVLRVQAAELRVKRRQRAEEKALKLPVKLVFPLAICILPSLFIILLGPAGIKIYRVLGGLG